MIDVSAFAQGFLLGLGMFVCPGPKDILILRQAIARCSVLELIAVGALSDAFLVWLGIAGASAALRKLPNLQNAALGVGVCLMLVHGLLSAKRAAKGTSDLSWLASAELRLTRRKDLAALLIVSFLNPVAWLDTVLVIGSVGAALPSAAQGLFALGSIAASFIWFLTLVAGGRWAGHWMTKPQTWRVLEGCVAVAMFGLATYVTRDLL